MTKIHPTAIVDAKAELDADVEVGAYATVGPDVKIGAGTVVQSHAYVVGTPHWASAARSFRSRVWA